MDNRMEIPWNPTVKKMTLLVIRELESYNEIEFREGCEELFARATVDIKTVSNIKKLESVNASICSEDNLIPQNDLTVLQNATGSWRPPARNSTRRPISVRASHLSHETSTQRIPTSSRLYNQKTNAIATPPLTITGVAPWSTAVQATVSANRGSINPPLTLTGVAPWTSPSSNSLSPSVSHSTVDHIGATIQGVDDFCGAQENRGLHMVRSYMERLRPPRGHEDENEDECSAWANAQMAESPVLLPDLKFHDLVFGHTLGSGAFSTVKYARQIIKHKTRSYWPEYAVKVNVFHLCRPVDCFIRNLFAMLK